jgi:hypothetical protein
MSSPLVDHNNSSKTSIVNDGVIKGVATHKPKGCKSNNSLDRKEDEGKISSKISKTFFLEVPSLHNFFLDVSLVIDIVEIIKQKKKQKHKGKNRKEKNTLHQV